MARRTGRRGVTGFILGVMFILLAIAAWTVWNNRLDVTRPAALELTLPQAPELPDPTPMPNPQPAPAPVPTPG
ncbi:MAG TPA: hypothetical protein PLO65_02575 [Caulobacter sp.]|nr:hypothetical protein [Caulobacter sp.]